MLLVDPPDASSQTLEPDPDGDFLGQIHEFLATEDTVAHLSRTLDDRHYRTDKVKAAIAAAAQPVHLNDGVFHSHLNDGVCHNAMFLTPFSESPLTPKGDLRVDPLERSSRISHPCEALARMSGDNGDLSPEPEPRQPCRTQVWHGILDEWDGDQDDISEKMPAKVVHEAVSCNSDVRAPRASAQWQSRASFEQAASEPNTARSVVVAASEEATIVGIESKHVSPGPSASLWRAKGVWLGSSAASETNETGSWNDLPSPIMVGRPHAEYGRDLRPRLQVSLNSHQSNAFMARGPIDVETNPYVRALRAHREEIKRNAVDLASIDDTADSLASRLATQRHDALASLTHEVIMEQHIDHNFARCGTETRCGPEPCYERGHSEIEVVCGPREGYPRLLRTPRTTDEHLNSARSYVDPREIAEGRATGGPPRQFDVFT